MAEKSELRVILSLDDQASGNLKKVEGNLLSMSNVIKVSVLAMVTKLGLELAGLGKDIIDSALLFEDKMADVSKTTGLTGEGLIVFGDELLEMNKHTRTSIGDLEDIAVVAGQLGIGADLMATNVEAATKEILDFTEATNVVTVALGDEFLGGAEQVTRELGSLRNVLLDIQTDDISQDMLHLGNVINVLSSEGNATAPVLTDMSRRISSLGTPLGMTSSQILGLSATMEELGISTERGGTSVGRVLQAITSDSDDFNSGLDALNINFDNFQELVNTDINAAFLFLAESLHGAGLSTTELVDVMDDLGIKGAGAQETFLKVGAATDDVRAKQDRANDVIGETNSLFAEMESKEATTQAALERLAGTFESFKITVGSKVLPVIAELVDGVLAAKEKFDDWYSTTAEELEPALTVLKDSGKELVANLLEITGHAEDTDGSFGDLATTVIVTLAESIAGLTLLLEDLTGWLKETESALQTLDAIATFPRDSMMALGDSIGWVINQLKDFLYWTGLAKAQSTGTIGGNIGQVAIQTQGFADGGIVPGTSTTGDRLTARVNSGEMILNSGQQSNLFDLLNSGSGSRRSGGDDGLEAFVRTLRTGLDNIGFILHEDLSLSKRTDNDISFEELKLIIPTEEVAETILDRRFFDNLIAGVEEFGLRLSDDGLVALRSSRNRMAPEFSENFDAFLQLGLDETEEATEEMSRRAGHMGDALFSVPESMSETTEELNNSIIPAFSESVRDMLGITLEEANAFMEKQRSTISERTEQMATLSEEFLNKVVEPFGVGFQAIMGITSDEADKLKQQYRTGEHARGSREGQDTRNFSTAPIVNISLNNSTIVDRPTFVRELESDIRRSIGRDQELNSYGLAI